MKWLDSITDGMDMNNLNKHIEVVKEKEMATHSSILAWKIPWTEEPGGLQSLGLQRVGHDRVTSAFIFTFIILL